MPAFVTEPVHVRVPATSANLGPGFDSFGLALTLYDELTVQVAPRALEIDVAGEGAADVPRDESHLVVRAMRAAFDHLGKQPGGLAIRCVNGIPHGRGLGSSAAAIVGGIVAARELVADGRERLDDEAALAIAAELEGHPDNVAACLRGGFTLAWVEATGPRVLRLDPSPEISPVVYVPPKPLATDEARAMLPEWIPHCDAAHSVARAALLVVAITGRPELLLAATDDRLHQSYRAPAMPETRDLVGSLRAAGVPAVISGAGPTVLALTIAGNDPIVTSVTDCAWSVYEVGIDSWGARRVPLNVGANP